jgi:hypothetical protein
MRFFPFLEVNFSELIIVSDCSNLIAKIKQQERNCSPSGMVIFDIKQLGSDWLSGLDLGLLEKPWGASSWKNGAKSTLSTLFGHPSRIAGNT